MHRPSVRRKPSEQRVLAWSVTGTVFFICIYTVTFNYLSVLGRDIFGGGLAVLHLILAAMVVLTTKDNRFRLLGALSLTYVLIGLFSILRFGTANYIELLRFSVGFFATIWLIGIHVVLRRNDVLVMMVATFVSICAVANTMTPIVWDGVERLAPVTGGIDLLHPSAYAALTCAVGLQQMIIYKRIDKRFALPLLLISVYTVLQYQVETAIFALLAYYAFVIRNEFRIPWIVIGITVPLVILLVMSYTIVVFGIQFSVNDISHIGSGRMGAWIQRFEILRERQLLDLLLGRGIGSDLYFGTYEWRSALKDAHNEFLTIVLEFGAIGLAIFISFWYIVCTIVDRRDVPVVIALLATSALSNGMMMRPLSSVFLFLVFLIPKTLLSDRLRNGKLGEEAARIHTTTKIRHSTP